VKKADLKQCPSSLTLVSEPARAVHCSLAGLKQPPKEFENDAGNCFFSYSRGSYKCQIEGVYQGKAALEKVQNDARRSRLCMWRHGDNYDDEEDDNVYVGRF